MTQEQIALHNATRARLKMRGRLALEVLAENINYRATKCDVLEDFVRQLEDYAERSLSQGCSRLVLRSGGEFDYETREMWTDAIHKKCSPKVFDAICKEVLGEIFVNGKWVCPADVQPNVN